MNPPAAKTTAVRRRAARWQRLGGQVVVLDIESQRAHSLDGVVAAVWEVADDRLVSTELVDAVRSIATVDVTADEVSSAVDSLLDAGLLEVVGEPRLDRRRLLGLGTGAALAGAALVTIGLPTPAAALSTGGPAPEFLNTSGYDLSGTYGDGVNTPTIASLTLNFTGTGTPPDQGFITIDPNVGDVPAITWNAPLDGGISLFDYVDLLDEPDRGLWMAATSVRVWFYDSTVDPDLYLGQAYFPDPA